MARISGPSAPPQKVCLDPGRVYMKRVFEASELFEVPDGTFVGPLIDTTTFGLPQAEAGTGGLSIAKGRIEPQTSSQIHVHPVVAQVTYVTSGALAIAMQDEPEHARYALELASGQASLCPPGTAFQLINESDAPVEVLYIVTPAFLFREEAGAVTFNDAVLLGDNWDADFGDRFTECRSEAFTRAFRAARKKFST